MRPTKAKAKAIAAADRGVERLAPLVAVLFALAAMALTGCNTVSGVGEDVSAAGQALDQTSERTQDKLSGEEATPRDEYQSGAY